MQLNAEWKEFFKDLLPIETKRELFSRLEHEYKTQKICPAYNNVFAAFNACKPSDIKVVILGQDPYFNENQATGLAFDIGGNTACTFPPTLRNIIKEVESCYGQCKVKNGDLSPWAKQGVLLLNTCLTVRQGNPLSHADIGWDSFTNAVITALDKLDNIVFVLWGSHAQKYRPLITNPNNVVLTSSHPSPLSANRGFLGCKHFCKINDFLRSKGREEIVW